MELIDESAPFQIWHHGPTEPDNGSLANEATRRSKQAASKICAHCKRCTQCTTAPQSTGFRTALHRPKLGCLLLSAPAQWSAAITLQADSMPVPGSLALHRYRAGRRRQPQRVALPASVRGSSAGRGARMPQGPPRSIHSVLSRAQVQRRGEAP
jgi:hypothetical protein